MSRVPSRHNAVQLPHEGYGPMGSPGLLVVVRDADLLRPQGLELNVTLAPRLLVVMLLHANYHALIDVDS